MRASLLKHLRCPDCAGLLATETADQLRCEGCARRFPILDGAPRFTSDRTDTAKYFGYIWGLQAQSITPPERVYPYHLQTMYDALGGPRLEGFILDGGCGDGEDLAMVALDPQCDVVGVELSAGGVATSLARTRGLERASVIQGDLLRIPIAAGTFDGAYSYGVVHHTPDPARAAGQHGSPIGTALMHLAWWEISTTACPRRSRSGTRIRCGSIPSWSTFAGFATSSGHSCSVW